MNEKRPLAIVGEGISEVCRRSLCERGFEVICLPPYYRLGKEVSTHADLMLLPLDGRLFVYGELADLSPELMLSVEERGIEVVRVEGHPTASYPGDIALNCLVVGKYIFCKKDRIARELSEYAESSGYTIVNTKQGYARCTACPASDRAIITADPSMRSAALSVGLEVLDVSVGGVVLCGYDYGFIGGACGVFGGRLYFAGNIHLHPDGERIEEFCHRHGMEVVSLSSEPLLDVGSIFFVGQ